ncbi:nickel-type superoxide dismutase maturation protease [Nodosilinea sp. P-1105]|nr:nickel-type superoxide dismutase maturation protease [Nodosilinea sp. P-1105]NMF85365.1 nickel-type superoxide dismutase maturation protease [Nodosilinea sp. P-1105]
MVPGTSQTNHPDPGPPSALRSSRLRDIALWLLRRRQRFRVTGRSMVPLLKPGEEVLLNPRAYRRSDPQLGDLVVAIHPTCPHLRLIKWVVYGEGGDYFLGGINTAASTDSRDFGLVPGHCLLGQVVCRFP